jgi:predicted ABC-type ATPase
MKEVIVVGGANGSGKSTLAFLLAKETGLPFINADETEKQLLADGFIGDARFEAGRLSLDRMERLAQGGASFIIESTLSGRTLSGRLKTLGKLGFRIRVIYIFMETPELCIARIKGRVQKGGHHIPDADVRRRFWRSLSNFWRVYRPLAEAWAIYANMGETPVQIAIGSTDAHTLVLDTSYFELFKQYV